MAKKLSSDVDLWLDRETDHVRKALETASRHFDGNDNLTVNTLEAIYGQESSFGLPKKMGERGSSQPAGHFQLSPDTAKRYGLTVTKNNNQRFDIDYASSASARYLKDLHTFFSKDTTLIGTTKTIGVKNPSAGKNPQVWSDVEKFVSEETRQYIPKVLPYENAFNLKSPANKNVKEKDPKKEYRYTDGHWVTIDDRPVFICD